MFADNRNGNWDIYCYDLSVRTLKRLTTSTASQRSPQIGGGRVVYQDRRNGNWDIYMYTLSSRSTDVGCRDEAGTRSGRPRPLPAVRASAQSFRIGKTGH